MNTFVVGEALEHDHDAIDQDFTRFREGLDRGEWLSEPFIRAAEALRHHIYVEEESLFPALRAGGLAAPVFVMLREHGKIWQALEEIATRRDRSAAATAEAMESLVAILEWHNSKEEMILYAASGNVLQDGETEAVRKTFQEGSRPEGWLPSALRTQG